MGALGELALRPSQLLAGEVAVNLKQVADLVIQELLKRPERAPDPPSEPVQPAQIRQLVDVLKSVSK